MELVESICDIDVRVTLENELIIVKYCHFFKTDVLAGRVGDIEAIKGERCHEIVKLVLFGVKLWVGNMELGKVNLHKAFELHIPS